MIDIEFVGQEKVTDAWHELFAHYVRSDHPGTQDQIFNEREELFATLVFEISRILKYRFNLTYVRDNVYRPTLHTDMDVMEFETRRLIHGILKSDALPVRFVGIETCMSSEAAAIPAQDEAKATMLPKPE